MKLIYRQTFREFRTEPIPQYFNFALPAKGGAYTSPDEVYLPASYYIINGHTVSIYEGLPITRTLFGVDVKDWKSYPYRVTLPYFYYIIHHKHLQQKSGADRLVYQGYPDNFQIYCRNSPLTCLQDRVHLHPIEPFDGACTPHDGDNSVFDSADSLDKFVLNLWSSAGSPETRAYYNDCFQKYHGVPTIEQILQQSWENRYIEEFSIEDRLRRYLKSTHRIKNIQFGKLL